GVVGRIHARQHGQVVLDLAPDPAHGDAEHALASLDQVEDVLGGGALVHRGTVAHEGDAGEVVDPALAQGADGDADLLEGDPGVQQALDDLQHQDVAEAVEALAAGAVRGAHAGLDQAGAGPVVQLAVGDAGGLAGGRAPVAELTRGVHHVVEEHALCGLGGDCRLFSAIFAAGGVHVYLRVPALRGGRMRAPAQGSVKRPSTDSNSPPEGHGPVTARALSPP